VFNLLNALSTWRIFSTLILVSWVALAQAEAIPAIEEQVAITEQQAIALFYQRNLSLIAASLNIDEARAREIIAAAIPNPVLSVTVAELNRKIFRAENHDQPLPAVIPQVQQLIETAGKRRLRIESSELATEAVGYDLRDVARTLTNAVRRSYYSLILAQKALKVANENFEHYREILRVNEIRLKVGDVAAMDFIRIEVEGLKAQSDQDQALAAVKQARADLLLLLGWPENSADIVAVEAWPEISPDIALARQDDLVRRALERRPDMQAARIRIAEARKMVTLAQRQVIPDVTISAFYDRDPGNFFARSGGVGISVPIPLFYQHKGEISKARVTLSSAELAVARAEQTIRAEVLKAASAWQSADSIARRFETSVVGRIETLRKSQELAYQKGAIGVLNLIDAQRTYRAVMLDYYAALANRSKAWADLLMGYGEDPTQFLHDPLPDG
jgi:outer membrane protein, heavy metal efflux system